MSNVSSIILAAGQSSRAGVNKLLLPVKDRTIIESTISGLYDISDEVIVVLGNESEQVVPVISKYDKVKCITNFDYDRGMFSSVKTGIKEVSSDRVFIIPGDCPFVSSKTYNNLIKSDDNIIIPTFNGIKGHPVLINNSLFENIISEPWESNLDSFIEKQEYKTIGVDDEAILFDIDTLTDYEKYIAYGENLYG